MGLLSRICFWVGAAGLLIAMAVDALAVVGRHARVPLLGSIEIVQACIVVAASAAMVGATLSRGHAAVHILLERIPFAARRALERFADLMGAVTAALLFAGSIWIVADLWGGHEHTEILRMPVKPLRLFWCASALLMAVLFLVRALAPSRRHKEPTDVG
jgi:TRAP-type C4-dicarboxylate transport system permease small subunit